MKKIDKKSKKYIKSIPNYILALSVAYSAIGEKKTSMDLAINLYEKKNFHDLSEEISLLHNVIDLAIENEIFNDQIEKYYKLAYDFINQYEHAINDGSAPKAIFLLLFRVKELEFRYAERNDIDNFANLFEFLTPIFLEIFGEFESFNLELLYCYSSALILSGKIDEGIKIIKRANRLIKLEPHLFDSSICFTLLRTIKLFLIIEDVTFR